MGCRASISSRRKRASAAPLPLSLTGKTTDRFETIGYGSYLVNAVASCNDCHQASSEYLAGGTEFDIPGGEVFARNLTPDPTTGLQLAEDQFIQAFEIGADFKGSGDAGTAKSLIVMRWPTFRWMTTADKKSIYAYLKAVPPVSNQVADDVKPAIPPAAAPTAYDEGAGSPRALPPS